MTYKRKDTFTITRQEAAVLLDMIPVMLKTLQAQPKLNVQYGPGKASQVLGVLHEVLGDFISGEKEER